MKSKKKHFSSSMLASARVTPVKSRPRQTESQFNFDLERTEKAVNAPRHKVPTGQKFDEFDKWVHRIAKD